MGAVAAAAAFAAGGLGCCGCPETGVAGMGAATRTAVADFNAPHSQSSELGELLHHSKHAIARADEWSKVKGLQVQQASDALNAVDAQAACIILIVLISCSIQILISPKAGLQQAQVRELGEAEEAGNVDDVLGLPVIVTTLILVVVCL